MTNKWLTLRLQLLGALVVLVCTVLVAAVFPTTAGLAGLAISSSISLTELMNWLIRVITELEVNMNAVERMLEYFPLQEERPTVIESSRPPAQWPSKGCLSVQKLWVRYRQELPPVLKDVTFELAGGQKLGVCGRTGSGKSTLMLAIYRLVEPYSGRMVLDGVEIQKIGLRDLRTKLSLVP